VGEDVVDATPELAGGGALEVGVEEHFVAEQSGFGIIEQAEPAAGHFEAAGAVDGMLGVAMAPSGGGVD
jgi:hypothetical protein